MRVAVSASGAISSETASTEANPPRSTLVTVSSALTISSRSGFWAACRTMPSRGFSCGWFIVAARNSPGEAKARRHARVGVDRIVGRYQLEGNAIGNRQDRPRMQVDIVDLRAVADTRHDQQVARPVV